MKAKINLKIMAPILVFIALIILGAPAINAAPGELDLSFGSGGTVVTTIVDWDPFPHSTDPRAILVQPDGKIVVCGIILDNGDLYESFFLTRYDKHGTLDASFGTNGKFIGPRYGGMYAGLDIALQPDGKIVSVGFSDQVGGFVVHRFSANGTLDASFGQGGTVITPLGTGPGEANSVTIQPDGKIVVVGYAWLPDLTTAFALARYMPDGKLDVSFNGTGKVITSIGRASAAFAAVRQPDGKIVAAGFTAGGNGAYAFALARYNTDGSLDPGFGLGGKVIHAVSTNISQIYDVALQPDGKIVATGGSVGSAIVRYNTNGSIDTTFAQNGIFTTEANLNIGASIALQPDGKLVAFGSASPPQGSAVARLNLNGTPDSSFGSNGRVLRPNHREHFAGSIQSDGKILAVGGGFPDTQIEIVRYLGGSAVPPLRANGKIAFTSDRDGNREIYLMNSDGTNQVRLTSNNIIDDFPTWSPDGGKIAFLSQRDSGEFAIFVMKPDGTGKTEIAPVNYLPQTPWNPYDSWSMSWAPDGSRIVFSEVISTAETLIVVNTDGSGRRNLSKGILPAWSPDGSKILFSRGGAFYGVLNTIRPDATGLQRLPVQGYYSTWSPDGLRIAFSYNDFANTNIYQANADGTNFQFFTGDCPESPAGCSGSIQPAWSPDGRTIAFVNIGLGSGGSGWEIYTKSLGGGNSVRLTNSVGTNAHPNWQPIKRAISDFDGDGRSDISVFRPSDRTWYLNRSTSGFSATQFGLSTDTITPADYDGDGKTDISVFRNGVWYWLSSSSGSFNTVQFGLASDLPVPADFTGDGRAELAVYRSGTWLTLDLSNNQVGSVQFGISTDKPVVADYDGDGRADQAVYRDGVWHLNRSSAGYAAVQFGLSTDKPVPADYDGDDRTDVAVFRDGTWYLLQSTNGFTAFQFGITTDLPAPADYDGDGKTDGAVYRDGTWYLRQSTGGLSTTQFGLANDRPLPAAYVQ